MLVSELIQRSPVRVFMNSISGGLKGGELGLIASLSGIGKTSVLVQIALDKLIQGKKVIHVSFTKHTDYVLSWYENIFDEFIKKKNLESERDVKNDIVKNRVLMKFTQGGVSGEQILQPLRALIKEGGFDADAIIIDGFDFSMSRESTEADDRASALASHIAAVKAFAEEMNLSVWYSCTVSGEGPFYNERNIPVVVKDFADLFAVIIVLEPKPDHIAFSVSQGREEGNSENLALKLDPKTMLILES